MTETSETPKPFEASTSGKATPLDGRETPSEIHKQARQADPQILINSVMQSSASVVSEASMSSRTNKKGGRGRGGGKQPA